MEFLGCLFILAIFIFVLVVVSKTKSDVASQMRRERILFLRENSAIHKEVVDMGIYQIGLEEGVASAKAWCAVSEKDFVIAGNDRAVFGRISRDRIDSIVVQDKTQISQRLSAAGIILFGPLALSKPKQVKHDAWALTIEWSSAANNKNLTVFLFEGPDALHHANNALNTLKNYTLNKRETLGSDEKKCPYCAETIKSSAVLCRFCKSRLESY